MKYHIFTEEEQDFYDIAILIKPTSFNKEDLERFYIDYLKRQGISHKRVIAYTLEYSEGKVRAKEGKEYLSELLPILEELGVKYIYCADAAYYKLLTKKTKAEQNLGYETKVISKDITTDMVCTLGVNYSSLVYNPDNLNKLNLSLETFKDIVNDQLSTLGADIIHSSVSFYSRNDIRDGLAALHSYPALTADFETTSLKFWEAEIVSVSFAWDKHNGYMFYLDNKNLDLIKEFFDTYQGNLKWHNCNYDLKIAVYNLYMKDIDDTEGMLTGIETLCRDVDDTKIVAYTALNSVTRPSLSLKALAHPFAGNYAIEEIDNAKEIDPQVLLNYNLVDCLSTWYVWETYYPILEKEGLVDLYKGLMMDSMKLLIQVELTGMPIKMDKVLEAEKFLQDKLDEISGIFDNYPQIEDAMYNIRKEAMDKKNKTLKTKQHTIDMYEHIVFNPNSNQHVQELLYNILGLPVIDLTKTKQPAVGADTLEKLLNHASDAIKPLLEALIVHTGIQKILSSFIPAFKEAVKHKDGYYLHGNFNIGGTASGRLSSSSPNLQNLPSGSTYGKLIKECFGGHEGWVMCGADFSSLEDRINALLTKDTNKLRVYTDGYDSHSMRAYAYFGKQMPDIRQTKNERCFECAGIRFTESDTITYQGKQYTGVEFYDAFKTE